MRRPGASRRVIAQEHSFLRFISMRVEKSVDGARRWTRCVTMMDDDARAHRVVHLKQFKCRGCSERLDKLIQHCITVHFCSSPNDSAWITWLRSFWIRGACRAQRCESCSRGLVRAVHLNQNMSRRRSERLDKLIQHCITVHFCSSPNDSAWIAWLRSCWIRGGCRAQRCESCSRGLVQVVHLKQCKCRAL